MCGGAGNNCSSAIHICFGLHGLGCIVFSISSVIFVLIIHMAVLPLILAGFESPLESNTAHSSSFDNDF